MLTGGDESGIDLNSPNYYEGKDGKTLTFYKWQEEKGIQILEGGAAGMSGKAAYSEIKRRISDQIQIAPHPFHVGEVYMVKS